MSDLAKLTPRQRRFAAEYLKDLNATQAAIRAGYSAKTADVQGPRLLGKVRSLLAEKVEAQLVAADISAIEVLRELAGIARTDVRELFDADGRLRPIPELPAHLARALGSVELETTTRTRKRKGKADEVEIAEAVRKVKLWDKTRALGLLARYHGLLTSKAERDAIAGAQAPSGTKINVVVKYVTVQEPKRGPTPAAKVQR